MIREAAVFVLLAALWSCSGGNTPEVGEKNRMIEIYGKAQGTTYAVKFLNPDEKKIGQTQVDSILRAIDNSLSSWVYSSTISKFNASDSVVVDDPHFINVFFRGKELSEVTNGAFHPMIMPLARAWGFGPEGGALKDDVDLEALKELVNFDLEIRAINEPKDSIDAKLLFLKAPGQQMDVNSYAQGYSVDVVAHFLRDRGITDYMVEIGGEIAAMGSNNTGIPWRIGIDKPISNEGERVLEAILSIKNAAVATSGTYRKFYEKDGKKYSHMIDPFTGRPVEHNLLSATVMADNCTNADAFATAFMVMGVEGTKQFVSEHPELGLEIFLIYDGGAEGLKSYMSEGMKEELEIL
jgi:thiamine biosynthesis lipoprotein